tara:strand:- start:64 stop:348 length:285 start_codon:yes stop_codon:yes gene_type:complete
MGKNHKIFIKTLTRIADNPEVMWKKYFVYFDYIIWWLDGVIAADRAISINQLGRGMHILLYFQHYIVSEAYLTESGWYFVFPPLWQDRLVHFNN